MRRYPRGMEDPSTQCPGTPEDLTWQFHRAAQRLRASLDLVCRERGLGDARDWVLLTALIQQPGRTQAELGTALGLDKTTLTALVDRLEAGGLVRRLPVAGDRRARVPEVTPAGAAVQAEVTRGRDAAEAQLLAAFTQDEQQLLRSLIARLVEAPCGETARGCS